jgi:hypothetical protein
MTTPEQGKDSENGPNPADLLAELLESAPPEARRTITAWLLRMQRSAPAAVGVPWLPPPVGFTPHGHLPTEVEERVRRLAGNLPPTADSQVVTVRLPATRHAALRDWCAEHGFSMAAVVRGLVERFLEERAAPS